MWALPVDWKPSVSLENDLKFVRVFPEENEWSAYKWRQQINSNGRSNPRERDNWWWLKTAWKSAKCFQCWNNLEIGA